MNPPNSLRHVPVPVLSAGQQIYAQLLWFLHGEVCWRAYDQCSLVSVLQLVPSSQYTNLAALVVTLL